MLGLSPTFRGLSGPLFFPASRARRRPLTDSSSTRRTPFVRRGGRAGLPNCSRLLAPEVGSLAPRGPSFCAPAVSNPVSSAGFDVGAIKRESRGTLQPWRPARRPLSRASRRALPLRASDRWLGCRTDWTPPCVRCGKLLQRYAGEAEKLRLRNEDDYSTLRAWCCVP